MDPYFMVEDRIYNGDGVNSTVEYYVLLIIWKSIMELDKVIHSKWEKTGIFFR